MSARASRLSRAVTSAVRMLRHIAASKASTPESRALVESLEDRTLFTTVTGEFWAYAPGSTYYCGPFYYSMQYGGCPLSITVNDGNIAGYVSQGMGIKFGPVTQSDAPVQYYSGQPVVYNTDLQSDGFGGNGWSQTRSYSAAIGGGPLGPGWDITDFTHLVDVTLLHQANSDAPSNVADTIAVVESGGDQRFFDKLSGSNDYTERLGGQDKLIYDSGTQTYTLYDSTGGKTVYGPMDTTNGFALFQSYTDSGGNTTSATYLNNDMVSVTRSNGSEYEKWGYQWQSMTDASGNTYDHLTSVTLSRSSDGGSTYSPVGSVAYAFYDGTTSGGPEGYLKSATIQDAGSNTIDVWAYRYYKAGESNGEPGDLKMVFNPQSYATAVAAGNDPTTAIDDNVKAYATNDFQYDTADPGNRVSSEAAQGTGCSCSGNAGQGSYTYSYVGSSGFTVSTPPIYNQWQERTTVGTVDPNGGLQSQEVVYTNAYGQPMLYVNQQLGAASTVSSISGSGSTETINTSGTYSVGDVVVVTGATWSSDNGTFEVKSVGSGSITVANSTANNSSNSGITVQKITAQSATYYRYHQTPDTAQPDAETGQLVLQADPSAVNIPLNLTATGYYDASQFGYVSYDFQYPDLVNFSTTTGLAAYLNTTTGLVNTFDSYFNENDIGWNFSGPAGVASNDSAISGTLAATSGTQAGFILQGGSMSQTLSFATGAYTLSFDAAQRDNVAGSNETLTVLVDGVPAGTFTPASTYGTGSYTASFSISSAGNHTISITGGYTLSNSGVVIDNVTLGGTGAPVLTDRSFEFPALVAGDLSYDPGGSTATSTTAGGAPGRFHDSFVQHGLLGAGQTQETRAYVAQAISYAAAYPLASDTVYTGPDGTGALTTTDAYTFYSGTTQPQMITETGPAVTVGQNGPGTSVTTYKFLDPYGRVIWTKDGDGYVNYTGYDNGTGAATKSIINVDYNKLTSAEQTSFNRTGWAQPTGGQNLVTITIPDGLGRPLAVIDPKGIVTVYAYNDANHETRVYPAWGTASRATATGTTTTLVDNNLNPTGSYVGEVLTILSGTDAWCTATVSGYNASTHTLTFSTAFPNATDSTSLYVLSSNTTVGPIQVSREYRPTSLFVGTATGTGSTTTLVDTNLSSSGSYIGQLLSLTAGTGSGQSARIIGYNSTSHTLTVDQPFTAATDATTQFVIGSRYEETMTELPAGGTSIHIAPGNGTGQIGTGLPDAGEAIGTIYSLSRQLLNVSNQVIEQDSYFSLSGATYSTGLDYLGSASNNSATGNFHATLFWYDERGDLGRTQEPTGTIFRTIYDYLKRPVSTWEGTNDTPTSGWWSPANNTGSSNMMDVEDFQYDNGAVGDGNLTSDTKHVDTTASHDHVTLFLYDWRDRLIAAKQGALMNNGTNDLATETGSGVNRLVTYYNLNNLGQTLGTYTYAGDGTDLSAFATWTPGTDSTKLRAYAANAFDNLGRVYRKTQYSVDPSTGSYSQTVALVTNLFYDKRSNLVAEADPGGLVYKHQFDGAGRDVMDSTTDGGAVNVGTMSWSNALSTTNDIVLEQKLFTYDPDSNLIETIDRQRFHGDPTDSSGEGNLDGPGSVDGKASRDYYSGSYYDAADRLTDSVNVGTNGGTAWAMPASVPTGSDTVLVTHDDYDLAGRLLDTVDPRGVKSGTFYDMLGRAIEVIGAWDGTQNPSPGNSTNQITTYAFNGNSNVISMTAEQPSSGGGTPSQTTDFIYGIGGTLRQDLFSNDVIGTIEYPDKATGEAASGANEQQSFGYDFQGEKISFTDQNGTVHGYTLDVLGRLTADIVTQFGSGVDQGVKSLGYAFNDAGLPFQQTSYNPSGGTVNQVEDVYNGYRQLKAQYQDHSGAVVVGTSPSVQYGYSTGDNDSRLSTMTYPNGRVLDYNYTATLDGAISRIDQIYDPSGSFAGADQSYLYLGLNTIVQAADGNGIELTYFKQGTESNGDAGDQYTGLDRFGRVDDQRWIPVSSPNSPTDRFQYGYDRNGNVLYKNNLVNSSFSELYHASSTSTGDDNTAYDPLNRLQAFEQGTLSSSGHNGSGLDTVSSPNGSQSWTLDAQGNWTNSGTFNAQNQETSTGSASLTYDNNGNTTTDQNGTTYTVDAWNHIATVNGADRYSYDALGHRIYEGTAGKDLYYDTTGNVIEERQNSQISTQNVWGLMYPNQLISQDQSMESNGSLDTSFNSTGKETTSLTGATSASAAGQALQSDGKLIVAGTATVSGTGEFALVRYNPDGSLDTSFGSSGQVLTSFSGLSVTATSVAIQSDGKIVVVGNESGGHIVLARYKPDGSLDTTFGTSGEFVGGFWMSATSVLIEPSGRIVVGGSSFGNFALAAFTSGGSLDSSFAGGGTTTTDLGGTDAINAMAFLSNGDIVAAGASTDGFGSQEYALAIYTAGGSLYTTFNGTGYYRTEPPAAGAADAVAIGPDGQIALAGNAGNDMCVMQLTGGYLLGTSIFNTTITVNTGYAACATGVAFGSDDKIVIGGWTDSASGHDFVTARVTFSGTFPYLQADSTYGTGGVVVTDLGGNDIAYSMLLEPNGSISLAGSSGSSFGLARFAGVTRRLYAQQDANWNITSWVDTSGNVVQRAVYGPYGDKTVLNADWSNLTTFNGVTFDPLHATYGYQGMRGDPVTGLLHSMTRDYDAYLGRWMQQDPTGTQYVNGANLYQMEMGNPVDHVDPSGLDTEAGAGSTGPTTTGAIADPRRFGQPSGTDWLDRPAPGVITPLSGQVSPFTSGGSAAMPAQTAADAEAEAELEEAESLFDGTGELAGALAAGTFLGCKIYTSGLGHYIGTTWLGNHIGDFAGAHFVSHGNQHNFISDKVRQVSKVTGRPICDILQDWYQDARKKKENALAQAIKRSQKAFGCRGSRAQK